jgi:DNA polymerase-3 subunit alpha
MQLGDQNSRAHQAGQNDLFGLASDDRSSIQTLPSGAIQPEWSERVRRDGERDTLGLYLTGHPIDAYETELPRIVSRRLGDLAIERPIGGGAERGFAAARPVTVAGEVSEIKKRGPRVILTLDDGTGRLEVTFFEETYQQYRALLANRALVVIEGMLRFDEFSDSWRLAARKVTELDKVREQQARRLVLTWPQRMEPAVFLQRLEGVLAPWRSGPCAITLEYRSGCASGAFTFASEWNVRPTRELIEQLEGLAGSGGVQVIYGVPQGSAGVGPAAANLAESIPRP